MTNPDFDYDTAFSRNFGLLSPEDQKKIRSSTVAIGGMGGVGGIYVETLARLGFEKFHLADFDSFDMKNFNRQLGAMMDTVGRPKVDVMKEFLLRINPRAEIKVFPRGVQFDNIDAFLDGVSLFFDAIDIFEVSIRRAIFPEAQRRGIPCLVAGPLGYTAALLLFGPKSPAFDKYFDLHDGMTPLEMVINFALGLAPAGLHLKQIDPRSVDLVARKGPSLSPCVKLCAALLGVQGIKILLGKGPVDYVPAYFQFDALKMKISKGRLRGGNRNPLQRLKKVIARRRFNL